MGVPFDSNSSCRSGARFAPWYIRLASEFLEEFSLLYRVDIRDCDISDWGDVDVSFGDFGETLRRIQAVVPSIGAEGYVFLGGDHTISIPIVHVFSDRIDRCVILDAHGDFYDEYLGNKYSHACVSRRLGEILGFDKISILGIRSLSRDNLRGLEEFGVDYVTMFNLDENILKKALRAADYLSIDMDFFDPSEVPNVLCPEPMGYSLREFYNLIPHINARFVDITEVAPAGIFDITAISTATLLREILIQVSSRVHV